MADDSEQPGRLSFSTRWLLAAVAWISLCYAMMFTIPPNLLLFCAVRFLAFLLLIALFILPVCLRLKENDFWLAASVSAFGLLLFSQTDGYSNPLTGYVTEFFHSRLGYQTGFWPAEYGFGFETRDGTIGRWNAIYDVVELNLVAMWSLLAGSFWHHLREKAATMAIMVWTFFWFLAFATLWKSPYDAAFTPFAIQFSIVTFISILLPSVVLTDCRDRPFWPVFSLTGFLIVAQLVPMGNDSYVMPVSVAIADQLSMRSVAFVSVLLLLTIPLGALAVASAATAIVSGRLASERSNEESHLH